MDVLFLVPPIDNNFLDQPQEFLGVCQLTSVLRAKGYEAEVFQPHVYNMDVKQIIDVVSKRKFRVLGISVMYNAIYSTIEIVKGLRQKGIKAFIVLGGYFPTLAPEEVLKGCPEIDCIMRGEGEETYIKLLERLDIGREWRDVDGLAYAGDLGNCIINKPAPLIKDINSLPIPSRDNLRKIILQKGFNYVMTSRGCYGDCLFCNIAAFFKTSKGSKWRYLEAIRIVDEIEYLVYEFGLDMIIIHDDNFLHSGKKGRERALAFADEIKKRKLDIHFSISCRTQDVEYELFSKLKEAGLVQVFIGVESMNQNVLDNMKKGTTIEDNIKALEILDSLWLPVCTYFIMFNAESKMDEIKNDVQFLKSRIMKGFGESMNYRFNFNSINLDLGTALAKKLKDAPFVKREEYSYSYEIKDKKVEKIRRLSEYMMEICEEPCRYLYITREWWARNDVYNSLEILQINAVIEVITVVENDLPIDDYWMKNTFGGLLSRIEMIIAQNVKLKENGKYIRYMPLYLFEEEGKQFIYDINLSELIEVDGVNPSMLEIVFDRTLYYNKHAIRSALGSVLEWKADNPNVENTVRWFENMKEQGYLKNMKELPITSFDREAAMESLRRIICQ